MVTSGDFSHVTLDSTPAGFHQVVDCPRRNNGTIDRLYANVRDAYRATPPPPGESDHNLVHLQPLSTPPVQQQPVTPRTIRRWSDGESPERLDGLTNPHGEDVEASPVKTVLLP